MFFILLFSCLISLHFILIGKLSVNLFSYKKISIKNDIDHIECGLYGIIFISIIALLINFFFKLSPVLNTSLFILSFISLIQCISDRSIIDIVIKSILSGLIITITLTLDNIYRPDGGMYHLPFISILNENKILLGISNIHFRFGFISIIQYLSAISNNFIFKENGITLAACSIYSFTILFFLKEIFKKDKNRLITISSILFLFFILYEFNRFGEHGNDETAYMFLFISVIFFLKINEKEKNKFFDLLIFCSFSFLMKPFLIFSLLMPLFYYKLVFTNKDILFDRKIFFIVFFLFLWILKNFLTTSCLLYPMSITCNKHVEWSNSKIYNPSHPEKISKSSEASAKAFMGWSKSSEDGSINRYLNEANWIKVWSKSHLPIVVKSLLPLCILSLIIILSRLKNIENENSNLKINKNKIIYLITLFFLCSIFWFFKFPIYRYGVGYLVCFVIFVSIYLNFYTKLKYLNFDIKILKYLIIFLLVGVSIKNTNRIYKKSKLNYNSYPWPPIFSEGKNLKNSNIKISIDESNNYYNPYPSNLCYYSISPCTTEGTKVNRVKIISGYKVYIIDDK